MTVLRSRALVVILILFLILVWLIFDQTGGQNPVQDAFARVFSPIQLVLQRIVSPVISPVKWLGRLRDLEAENEALRKENAELRNQIVLLHEAQIENENLRRQLNFKSAVPSFKLLSAEVIGRDPNNLLPYLIIDRGSSDEIRKGMPVLTAEGLVGRISEVTANSSKVMLITDPSSSVSVLIQRSRATGSLQGYPGNELVMRYISQGDTVMPGDIVLTAGLGGNFPRRLLVGRVASVIRNEVDMFQEARVVPAVNLRNLENVMVLLSFTPIDLAQEGTGS